MSQNFVIDIVLLEVSKERILWRDLSDDSEHGISLGFAMPDEQTAIRIWQTAILSHYSDKLENKLKLNFK